MEIGSTELEYNLSEKITQHVLSAERVRFVNAGTETLFYPQLGRYGAHKKPKVKKAKGSIRLKDCLGKEDVNETT